MLVRDAQNVVALVRLYRLDYLARCLFESNFEPDNRTQLMISSGAIAQWRATITLAPRSRRTLSLALDAGGHAALLQGAKVVGQRVFSRRHKTTIKREDEPGELEKDRRADWRRGELGPATHERSAEVELRRLTEADGRRADAAAAATGRMKAAAKRTDMAVSKGAARGITGLALLGCMIGGRSGRVRLPADSSTTGTTATAARARARAATLACFRMLPEVFLSRA